MPCYECRVELVFIEEVKAKGAIIHKLECRNCGKDFTFYLTPPIKIIQMPQYSA